jgi:hypothetical protein
MFCKYQTNKPFNERNFSVPTSKLTQLENASYGLLLKVSIYTYINFNYFSVAQLTNFMKIRPAILLPWKLSKTGWVLHAQITLG